MKPNWSAIFDQFAFHWFNMEYFMCLNEQEQKIKFSFICFTFHILLTCNISHYFMIFVVKTFSLQQINQCCTDYLQMKSIEDMSRKLKYVLWVNIQQKMYTFQFIIWTFFTLDLELLARLTTYCNMYYINYIVAFSQILRITLGLKVGLDASFLIADLTILVIQV